MIASLLLVFVIAAFLAGQVNRGIYGLAWHSRPISPWSRSSDFAARRTWIDRLPIIGWWFLRRESDEHGAEFWIRPLMVEAFLATGLTLLYWFERNQGLLPSGAFPQDVWTIQLQFGSHALLILLMSVATFIDLDEKTIPDEITLPGTLAGLSLASLFPESLLPAWTRLQTPITSQPLLWTTPQPWPAFADEWVGLGLGLACVVGWWYALLPKTLWYRGGTVRFFRYLVASILRHPHTVRMTGLAAGVAVAVAVRWWLGGSGWRALLTALVGLAVAGALVWVVRVVASMALQQEAMGFGDVTLMGMIGAFLGWQPALMAFFLAPFAGVAIALAQWVITGRKEIAYGPFLCLATALLLVFWPAIWSGWGLPLCSMGVLLPAVLATALALLGVMLLLIQILKSIWRRFAA